MARQRQEVVLNDDGNVKTLRLTVGQPDGTEDSAEYTIPSNEKAFMSWVAGLSTAAPDGAESPAAEAYRFYVAGKVASVRAEVYKASVAASTFITSGKEKINLMDFPLENFIEGHNSMVSLINVRTLGKKDAATIEAVEKSIGFGPWHAAALRHVENKSAVLDSKGMLVAA